MNSFSADIHLLWGSPLPPIRTGVADYAVELLPELVKSARVRVLRPPGWTPPDEWPSALPTVSTDTAAEPDEVTLIHLGNNPHHSWLTARLDDDRVVVVLHDAVLHHLLVETTWAVGDKVSYREQLSSAHGAAGSAIAAARAVGVAGRLDPFLLPARQPFLDRAAGVVVHSAWAEGLIRNERPGLPVTRVGLAVADPGPTDRVVERQRLGLEPDDVVVMHLGFLTPEKGMTEILAGLAAAIRLGVSARLVIVGEGRELSALRTAAAAVGIEDRILTTGWVEPDRLPALPAAADLGVVIRTPSAGETSAAAVRFLACGTPVAVGGNRQFLEWPSEAAPRFTSGPAAPAELARLLAAAGHPSWIDRRRAARTAYERSHRPEEAARKIAAFIDKLGL